MKEKPKVIIICLILLVIAIGINYFNFFSADFNFYRSELTINGTNINEKIFFNPNKNYHTLYRNFYDPLIAEDLSYPNSISINNVKCSQGKNYVYSNFGQCFSYEDKLIQKNCMPYTELNEYGCGFGYETGFKKGQDYWIETSYELNPENIFSINGKNYIKFVVYSPGNHVFLNTQKNFIINGEAVYAHYYFTKESAVIYIPYEGSLFGKEIIQLNNFKFDTNYFYYIIFLILTLFPSIGFYLIWMKFGKEVNEIDVPDYLSNYPKKRSGWEVAAFFTTPFGQLNKNLISSIILSLYHKKIIDIKIEKEFFGDKSYFKILKEDKNLDKIEKEFLNILKFVTEKADKKYFKDSYLNFSKAASSFSFRYTLPKKFRELQKNIGKETKEYISYTGAIIYGLILVGLMGVSFFAINSIFLVIFLGFSLAFTSILGAKMNLLSKFKKEEDYREYKEWHGFKKYLEGSESIRKRGHQAVIMWDEYLVYAAALGVSKKVLEELKNNGVITEQQYGVYVSTYTFSTSVSHSGGSATGHGGAGGGGVGGGGGGGR